MNHVSSFSKIALILIIISLGSPASEGAVKSQRRQDGSRACLNYGHACWGAHGKRSSDGDKNILLEKLLQSELLQQPIEYKPIEIPSLRKSAFNQWIPNWFDIYEKKRKRQYYESY